VSSELRYARQTVLEEIGAEGQARLGSSRALLVGLGGLGCPAAQYLATSGVGCLVLNDFDRVDESNLPRQVLFAPGDVGRLKVEAAAARLRELNPSVEVEQLAQRLDEPQLTEAVGGVDVVLDGTDNFGTRFAINKACVDAGVALVSGGSKVSSLCFRMRPAVPATAACTAKKTNGSEIARVTACWRRCRA